MVNKTQEELEQPVKGYQLATVEAKVDSMNLKMDTLLSQTSGLVTVAQLDAAIKTSEEKIHLEYRPLKKNLSKFIWLLISGIVTVIVQGVIIYVIATGK